MQTLSRSLLPLGLVCALVSTTAAQPPSDEPAPRPNALAKGAWALQFEIMQGSQNFTLQPFQGFLLSAKHHWSEHRALRFGLDLSASLTSSDRHDTFRDATQVQVNVATRDDNAQSTGVSLQYLAYPRPGAAVNLYFAVGPSFRFSRAHSEAEVEPGPSSPGTVSTQNRHSWAPGVSGAVGVEWFAARWLSLLAEYGAGAEYFSQKDTALDVTQNPTQRSERVLSQHGFRFDQTRMKLGLSIYF